MPIEIQDQTLYKLKELRGGLGISKDTLRRKIRDGELLANKLGRELVVWGSDLRAYINAQGRGRRGGYARQLTLKAQAVPASQAQTGKRPSRRR